MNILLLTIGSRGDIEPFIALGVSIQAQGHQVYVCTHERFQSIVEKHGLNYQYLSNELFKLMEGGSVESMGSLFKGIKTAIRLMKLAKPINEQLMVDSIKAGIEVEPKLVIYHPKCIVAPSIAEKFNVPAVMALLQPMLVKTSDFPLIGLPNISGITNRLSYRLASLGFKPYLKQLNLLRNSFLNLPKLSDKADVLSMNTGKAIPVLHAFSKHIVTRPQDWPQSTAITGYWFLQKQNDYSPEKTITDFMADGKPPIYIGFGSMSGKDPVKTARLVIDAVIKAKVRAIIVTGWGGLKLDDVPSQVLVTDAVPHDWLFPQVAAVVHHGGAGTTAAGLKAGKPTLICPFFADQPFWGEKIAALGLGPTPIKQKNLTVDNLAEGILQMVTDQQMQQRAQQVAELLSQEDGIENAIKWLKKQGVLI
ncbi:glycosyltransferase [Shewanella sp. KT0246]|uniref:glycosyltransferase n=1 Tax=Shewanella sp. KT0246 TaxID=2815912 RepID=UPI001BBF3B16|nr:glycosyltransferase [Shewanella sp. KT0246]GIU53718.1 glycosyl transferase family 1 [Shewanella sp. KT0246]